MKNVCYLWMQDATLVSARLLQFPDVPECIFGMEFGAHVASENSVESVVSTFTMPL